MVTRRTQAWAIGIALACAAVPGCKKRGAETPGTVAGDDAPKGPRGASEIWALAPEDAAWGIVARDGALAELQGALMAASAIAAVQEDTRVLWAGRVAPLLRRASVPLLDPAGMADAGIDLKRGGALFFGQTDELVLVVIPVGDVDRLVRHLRLEKQHDGGRTLYRMPRGAATCWLKEGRMLCARTRAAMKSALAAVAHPLASSATLVPQAARGDVEMLVDLTRHQAARESSRAVAPFWQSATTLSVSLGLERGAGRVLAWMDGSAGPLLAESPGPLPEALEDLHVGATGVTRIRAPLNALIAGGALPDRLPLGDDTDLRADLLEHLTGDIAIVSRGNQLGSIVSIVDDRDAVAARLPGLCRALATRAGAKREPRVTDDTCRFPLALAEGNPMLASLGRVDIKLGLEGDALVLETGGVEPPAIDVGPHARTMLDPDRRFVTWGRVLDPLVGVPSQIGAAIAAFIPADARPVLRAARWLAGHVYVFAASLRTEPHGLYAEGLVVTALADPPAVVEQYQRAVEASVAGDFETYRRGMVELAAQYPDTYAGRLGALLDKNSLLASFTAGMFVGMAVPAMLADASDADARDTDADARDIDAPDTD